MHESPDSGGMGRATGGQFVEPHDLVNGDVVADAYHGATDVIGDQNVQVGDATAKGNARRCSLYSGLSGSSSLICLIRAMA